MADDLDAFFEDVDQAAAEAEPEEVQLNKDVKKRTLEGAEMEEAQPASKKAKRTAPPPPPRPRGVVVAAASVKTAANGTKGEEPKETASPATPSKAVSSAATAGQQSRTQLPPSVGGPPSSVPAAVGPQVGPALPPGAAAKSPPPPPPKPHKPHVRTAAGKTWVDPTLADWPDDDFRLFVGNADPAVSDEQLYEHFRSRFASTRRARIVRDQHGKSRGYGFVSLSDALECAQALRTMDQTWLGGRPVRVKRSHWKDREWKERKKSEKQRNKKARRWGML